MGTAGAELIAFTEDGKQKKFTPASDRVFEVLRPTARFMFSADEDYEEAFDLLELLIAVVVWERATGPISGGSGGGTSAPTV